MATELDHTHSHGHDHHHSHDHAHDHASHSHAPQVSHENERRVFWAMLLTGGFMVAEVAGGLMSGSLALIADAGHMATDAASLLLAWFAFRLSRRPADGARSYGFYRAEILAAFVNGLAMIALVVWIAYEAVTRFFQPVEVLGGLMLAVAAAGLLVNIAAFALLHGGAGDNLNIKGAAVHVMGDLLGSLAAIAAAGIILWTGWMPIDPLLSLLVALLVLRSAWFITKQSAHILMEGTPSGLNLGEMRADLCGHIEGVEDVHHLHAWSLTQERPVVTLHARISEAADGDRVLRDINTRLAEVFSVSHATVQIERESCEGDCAPPAGTATAAH
ncbi:Co/Zn/Cd efflux system component [Tepidicaulis marinus]|uniref:Co/Zn/Cd efflux system component n=1 Tax=Tepidicaulis marinus TaxID=1333998 RepID=A0A081B9W0_9HYPH|nr:cation diffusion facilitator family transporter [Tepidicaulis marinus]GAK44828.1 Co/Zn/Cd efflux system component [Tepidicaulis marinus]